ncbi:hypothetical protein BLNAU_3865 [Blattamonas nauphoetae]|uniref:Uncharacterized protein n=1 Tax=Blattamonas nauphoetae TaxID=2049346 RepID=A0ABQ9YBF2_9EUKA|nr:hypothetical protein BLNAU_3865 [Blattamonas nauphoetae]
MGSEQSVQNGNLSPRALNNPRSWNLSNISSLLERLQCDDEEHIVDTLRILQTVASGCCSCMESLFFEPEIVDSLFLQHEDFIDSTFNKIGKSSPPSAVITTLARISLHKKIEIAFNSLKALYSVVYRNVVALTHIPSPIFPSSSPHQQYSGHSFLPALTKNLRIVYFSIQRTLPTDSSHLPKYVQFTKDDKSIVARSLLFCSKSFLLSIPLLLRIKLNEVDSEIVRELILFVKASLITILTTISNIDTLITSLPSDSSPTTPLGSGIDTESVDSLKRLRDACEEFVNDGWRFFERMAFQRTEPHKTSFQRIILDDPSFPDLILNSLKLNHKDIRQNTLHTITHIVVNFPSMKERFMTASLVWRMFETVDFARLPHSESKTLLELTLFIANMFDLIEFDVVERFLRYSVIRDSVFEPAKQFITLIFRNSEKLALDKHEHYHFESCICRIHNHIKMMELRADEHDADFVSELVKWEVRTMIEMENEHHFKTVFDSMLNRTQEWRWNQPERQKRREVVLREEGWDDVFELRVVGIEVDTNPNLQHVSSLFRFELTLNAN